MEDFDFDILKVEVFTAFGEQMKKECPWYPQEFCQDAPHVMSAFSIGESEVIKYGITYPPRTGITKLDEAQYLIEKTTFLPIQNSLDLNDRIAEEIFMAHGVCIISQGPLGGPSVLKGLYRPLESYGTGCTILQVIKVTFPNSLMTDADSNEVPESFICLAERGGISIYDEHSSETHVAHVPEFQIDKLFSCKFGLIVVPTKGRRDPFNEFCKGVYILTHPIKQVSKLWIKHRIGQDYVEYDASDEKLMWSEDDITVFWSCKNDRIYIRRMIPFQKEEVLHLTTLNAATPNTSFASLDMSSKFFLHGNSPFSSSKQPFTRSAAMKANKEQGSFSYWSSFDFSSNSSGNSSLGHGFYPPHVCIYDDPEVYLKPLFQIDLPKSSWKEPRKFQFVRDDPCKVSIWFLVKTNLHCYGIDVASGTKLGNYSVKNTEDFIVCIGEYKLPIVVLLDSNQKLGIGWLDVNYSLVCTTPLDITTYLLDEYKSFSLVLETVLFGDTVVCLLQKPSSTTIENESECDMADDTEKPAVLHPTTYLKIRLKNYRNSYLVRKCLEVFKTFFESRIITKLIARITGTSSRDRKSRRLNQDETWHSLVESVPKVILSEPKPRQIELGKTFLKAIATFKENLTISTYYNSSVRQVDFFINNLSAFLNSEFPGEDMGISILPILPTFAFLLLQKSPKLLPELVNSLPEVLQILLDHPDSFDNLERLGNIEKREKFIPLIQILLSDLYHRNSGKMKFRRSLNLLTVTRRSDLISGRDTSSVVRSVREDWISHPKDRTPIPITVDESNEESAWMRSVLTMRIFAEDRRLEEACRILDSSTPILIDTEQRVEMSDHEFVEEQEKHLLQLVQVTLAAPVGRTALTLRTSDSLYTSLNSSVSVPPLACTGRCKLKGSSIELSEGDLPSAYTQWPHFHNAVGAAMSNRFSEAPADAWFAFTKTKIPEGAEQAGMILGFGLNGILSGMPQTLRHEYLSKENSFMTMAMLLGLGANLLGTGDMSTWKLISLHIGAMLPACTTELEIPRLATLSAPCALGLLFLGTQNSYVGKILLGEMSKKFTPLSYFGASSSNNSASTGNQQEGSGTATDREAHSLCAGLGLGFVNLAKGRIRANDADDDTLDGILRRFVVGGPKPVQVQREEDPMLSNPHEHTLPSMWEEYRCCHIQEGDNVNVDVTTPAAIVAVALTYIRTGNEAVLNWLSPPRTLHLLDGVRPDLLLLRSLASVLVFGTLRHPDVPWLESNLMPATLKENALKEPEEMSRLNYGSINQCWASIVCGYCLGLGIRYAGTSDDTVKKSIKHYIDLLLQLSSKESKLCEFFPKHFLESCLCNLLLSSSLVVAGSGCVSVLCLCRYLQRKVSMNPVSSISSSTYGLEMCISMATGILFLGGGRYSLSNDDRSVAMLLASVFPKWPINANDNRYHIQALRHFYLLAAQPRLILPKPMPKGSKLMFTIHFRNGSTTSIEAPVLLPPFYLIKKINMEHDEYYPIEFRLPRDLPYLNHIVKNQGILNLVHKPIGSSNYGFVREMTWKEDTKFHSTFELHNATVGREEFAVKDMDLIYQLGEWCGMREIVPQIITLLYPHRKANKDLLDLQVQILHYWTEMYLIRNIPPWFPEELLWVLRTRLRVKIFQPKHPQLISINATTPIS